MKGWLINDCLTAIPNTRTFWHDLLEWFPDLEDKTGFSFQVLPEHIERIKDQPDYIIRNATFFRPLKIDIPTISLLQDIKNGHKRSVQIEVCSKSSHVVFNSRYIYDQYKNEINAPHSIIPLGTDSNLFKPFNYEKTGDTIIFVGSTNAVKGFALLTEIINKTNYKYILVLKDNDNVKVNFKNKNVSVYRQVNQQTLNELLNLSDVMICTSERETLHLSGIEAMLAGVPVVAPNIGIYSDLIEDDRWGVMVDNRKESEYIRCIHNLITNTKHNTRQCAIENKLTKEDSKQSWISLVENLNA